MITAHVLMHPRELTAADVAGRTVVVFDVLRATTTITAALAAGVKAVRVFDSIDGARQAAAASDVGPILCGEIDCLPPAGCHMGNSPRQWDRSRHAGSTVFLSTTNGTRAIAAASVLKPAHLLVAAMINARAAARVIERIGLDATLLCAGTNGQLSMEDLLGCGAVLDGLAAGGGVQVTDSGHVATCLFESCKDKLPQVFRTAGGGRNLIRAKLEEDIDFCARLNTTFEVGHLLDTPGALTICPFPDLED